MGGEPSITYVDDDKLIEAIRKAQHRLVFLAPGVNQTIAAELSEKWEKLGVAAVTVILDVDPEVCRLGYGTVEGLQELRDCASRMRTLVCHQPGVRIGLLISDDRTYVYSPTPLLIEAGSNQPEHPNAIALDAVPKEVARDVGLGDNPTLDRVIGLDPVKPHQIDELAQDLFVAPPVKFNLARQVRVFTSRFQFVELNMTGCYVSQKKVPIPSSLIGLSKEADIENQFHAHFNLVNKVSMKVEHNGEVITEAGLRKKKQKIVKDYLILLKGYGSVVLRAEKEKLEAAVETLRQDVAAFSDGITQDLQVHMDNNANSLVKALLPTVKENPPREYTKRYGAVIPEKRLRDLLTEDIKAAFGNAEKLVKEMHINLLFKDVAYESLIDKEFLKVARKAIRGVSLHEEFDAAKATQESS